MTYMLPFICRMVNKVLFFKIPVRTERHIKMGWDWSRVNRLVRFKLSLTNCHIYELFTSQVIIPSFHPLLSFSFIPFFPI